MKINLIDIKNKSTWFSVGLKLMLGVGIISSLCIGVLVRVNQSAFQQVQERTHTLLEMNTDLNGHLRTDIIQLQEKYLKIPELLQVDPGRQIINWVTKEFMVTQKETLEGREKYSKIFNRSQRRDIAKGRFIVTTKDNDLVLSKGITNENNEFTDKVTRFYLSSPDAEKDKERITTYVEAAFASAQSEDAVKLKILELKNILATEALDAEKSRNAILYKVEEINRQKMDLNVLQNNKFKTIRFIAVVTISANLVILFFMTWLIIEKPLKQLTQVLENLNGSQNTLIPYEKRKDRIGTLAGALRHFRDVLGELKKEEQRKKQEREIIDELISQMAVWIQGVQEKAAIMEKNAFVFSDLARSTEEQSTKAQLSVSNTVSRTETVCESTRQLESSVENIGFQVAEQRDIVAQINALTHASQEDMNDLIQASDQINDIVNIVKNIAKETKLLALNARIEAARAGSAGKGFNVVAREVRDLSVQTEEANAEIFEKIDSIQQASQAVVKHIRQVETRIVHLVEGSRQIFASVKEQKTITAGISENIYSASDETRVVSGKILEVKNGAEVTSRLANDVKSNSQEIAARLSELLKETQHKLSRIGGLEPNHQKQREVLKETPVEFLATMPADSASDAIVNIC